MPAATHADFLRNWRREAKCGRGFIVTPRLSLVASYLQCGSHPKFNPSADTREKERDGSNRRWAGLKPATQQAGSLRDFKAPALGREVDPKELRRSAVLSNLAKGRSLSRTALRPPQPEGLPVPRVEVRPGPGQRRVAAGRRPAH